MSSNNRPKPHLNEFLLRNIPLREALSILARWDALNDAEIAVLGLSCVPEASEEFVAALSAPVRSLMN